MKHLILVTVLCTSSLAGQLSQPDPRAFFEAAGSEFNVPPDILKGIAFAETRWEHLEWAAGDTASCTGLPRVYGIMALRDDPYFGRSLRVGATLIGESVETVRRDPMQNIRAAAAYLRKLYAEVPTPEGTLPGSLESWQHAIARYCGIPQPGLAAQHAYEILARLQKGYSDFGIHLEPCLVNMQTVRATAQRVYEAAAQAPTRLQKPTGQPDYPLAHWAQAYPGHWYETGYSRDFVVIHDMEGYYLSVISYFQLSTTNASIHYDVNGLQDSPSDAPAGDITQQVEEQYWAWHAVCLNRYSFGIEHEGFVSNPAWWTPEMYQASGKLVKYLCERYNIPKDRNHIIGHNEYLNSAWVSWALANGYPSTFATCNSHTDPGKNWDWGFLMQLITEDHTPPRVVSVPPSARIQVFDRITVTFDQRMDRSATEGNFHVNPQIPGTFSWVNGFRTLEFIPTSPLAFDAEYSVSIDTGAHNYLGVGLDVNGDGIAAGEVYAFAVRTVANDTIPPVLVATYPSEYQTGISTTVQFEAEVNEPIDPASLAGAFVLQDAGGSSILLSSPVVEAAGTGIRAVFRPISALAPSSNYTLIIPPSMRDYGGNTIAGVRNVPFTTGVEQTFNGTVINTLDAIGSWWQPGTSGSTVGTSFTSFAIATDIKKSGGGSGKVSYVFSGSSGGTVREFNGLRPSVEPGPYVAAWVFGDNSRNALEFWFYPLTFVRIDTLDWAGWKLVSASISSVPTTATRQFAGFVIQQLPGARTSGAVYFDDLAVGSGVLDAGGSTISQPENTSLLQNYPNPFNPTTVIGYQLAEFSEVHLTVFDMLGREVATLAGGQQPPGIYQVTWDAGRQSAGVYFCRLQARAVSGDRTGNVQEIRKILFLK